MSQSDLRDFIDRSFGGDPDAPAPAEPAAVFDDDDELEGDETEPEDGDEGEGDAEYRQLATAFWGSLDDADREAAEQSETVRTRLWADYLEEQGLGVEDEDDQEAEDAGVEPGGFASAEELIEAALANQEELVDGDGRPMTVAAWLNWAASAPEREWIEAARAAGLDPRVRPSFNIISRYGKALRGAVAAESWADHVAKRKAQGRFLGS